MLLLKLEKAHSVAAFCRQPLELPAFILVAVTNTSFWILATENTMIKLFYVNRLLFRSNPVSNFRWFALTQIQANQNSVENIMMKNKIF